MATRLVSEKRIFNYIILFLLTLVIVLALLWYGR